MAWLSSTFPQLWVNNRTDGSLKLWTATHLGEGNTPKSNLDKTRKFWLTAYLEELYLGSKISGPPGWRFIAKPTISPSMKSTVTEASIVELDFTMSVSSNIITIRNFITV